MNPDALPFLLLSVFTAAVLGGLALHSWRGRASPSAIPFVVFLLAVAIWVVASGLEMSFRSLEAKLALAKAAYPGIVTVAPAFFLIALCSSGREHWVTRRSLAALAVVPVITLALVLSNELHGLIWSSARVDLLPPCPVLVLSYGPAFWVSMAYSHLLLLLSAGLLFGRYRRGGRRYRAEAVLVSVGFAAPWIANLYYLSRGAAPRLDLTPFAFAVTGLTLAWSLLRHHGLFGLVRVARSEIAQQMQDCALVADMRGRLVYANSAARSALGLAEIQLPKPIAVALADHPELVALLRGGAGDLREIVLQPAEQRSSSDVQVTFDVRVTPLTDPRGVVTSWILVLRDISERKRAEATLQANEILLRKVIDLVPHVIFAKDRNGRYLLANRSLAEAYGVSVDELVGRLQAEFHENEEELSWALADDTRVIETGCPRFHPEIDFVDRSGRTRTFQTTKIPFTHPGSGEPAILGLSIDITERKQAEKKVKALAFYDGLTGLVNRQRFQAVLSSAIETARRRDHRMALLFVDLDRLKEINDRLGHSAGDCLLREVAWRLDQSVRFADRVHRNSAEDPGSTVSRLGGDEFTILLTQISDTLDAAGVARRILEVLAEPFLLEGQEVFTSASVGIAVFPSDADAAQTLLHHADKAMYHAKRAGGNQYKFFAASMNTASARRQALETGLRHALERAELSLHYQPVRTSGTGEIDGVEALLRWSSPELGEISPVEFIPVAEKTGLIHPIGEWVLAAACARYQAWRAAGLDPVCMSVNLSGYQLRDSKLLSSVIQILEETQMSASALQLEIQEGSIMADDEASRAVLCGLDDLGIQLVLDAFGSGTSSLICVRNLPFGSIKIDRSFVAGIPSDPDDCALVSGVIALARSLRLRTVAAGVETPEQMELLRDWGCDALQGNLISPAVTPSELERYLERERSG